MRVHDQQGDWPSSMLFEMSKQLRWEGGRLEVYHSECMGEVLVSNGERADQQIAKLDHPYRGVGYPRSYGLTL